MTVFIYQYFESLKNQVVKKAGFNVISTNDCKYLSVLIQHQTKKSISETTLKRVYGFATSRFKPSAFTMDVLAQFCGFINWDDFCRQKKLAQSNEGKETENHVFTKAENITRHTLQALKNRSTIPFHHTIERKIVHDHLSVFLKEDYLATAIIAPTGHGKTIALCHWLEGQQNLNLVTGRDDVYLFFSSHVLTNSLHDQNKLEDLLMEMMGLRAKEDFDSLFSDRGRKLYLLIDGFDDFIFKPEQFQVLLDQLIDILLAKKDSGWFKLILTMCSTTWLNHQHQLQTMRNKWYMGFMQQGQMLATNMQTLSFDELLMLSEKINPAESLPKNINEEVLKFLSHPEHFQYYYHSVSGYFTLNDISPGIIYSLLSSFILDKVYKGKNSSGKLAIIDNLVKEMRWQKQQYSVDKILLNNTIKEHPYAYRLLISLGIINEINTSKILRYSEVVQFGSPYITSYFLARIFIENKEKKLSQKLIKDAQDITVGDGDYMAVLKWVVLYALSVKDFKIFDYLLMLKLYPVEKADLVIFIFDRIGQSFDEYNEDAGFNTFLNSKHFFCEQFIKLNYVNTDFERTMLTLLRFKLPNDKKVLINCMLATSALLKADMCRVKALLHEIKSLPAPGASPLNIVSAIEALYNYFQHGIIDKEFLKEITHYNFNPQLLNRYHFVNELIILVALCASLLSKNPCKVVRFVRTLNKTLPNMNGGISAELAYTFSLTEFYVKMYKGHNKDALIQYNFLQHRYNYHHHTFTPLMQLPFLFVKSMATVCINIENDVLELDKQINQLSKSSNYMLLNLINKAFLLSSENINNLSSDDLQDIRFSLIKQTRTKGLRMESFMQIFDPTANEAKHWPVI